MLQHDNALWDVYQKLVPLLESPDSPTHKEIGFNRNKKKKR
jgi:hypothetical protein